MPTVRGKSAVKAFMAETPAALAKLLRGAGRAGGQVIVDEAKDRSISPEVSKAIVMKTKSEGSHVTVKITVKPGWARSVGTWLEYGTDPHFITVDDSQRGGRSVGRINRLSNNEGSSHSLVIGGSFVGSTVLHPGARAHPFLRVSLDTKEAEAVAAAQSYINAHVKPSGIVATSEPEGDA